MRKVLGAVLATTIFITSSFPSLATNYTPIGEYGRPGLIIDDTEEQIAEEERLGEMELMAQLVEAEAGNQPFEGKVKVAEVLLNRKDSPLFPDTIEEVIYQKKQFAVIKNGAFDKAAWHMQEDDYLAVEYACTMREDREVLYFSAHAYVPGTTKLYQIADHCFSK